MEDFFVAALLGFTGFLLGSLARSSHIKKILLKVSITPFYWKFVFPFSFFVGMSYWAVFVFASESRQEIFLNLVGQVSTLVFGIFVGWYAFIQVVRSQSEKASEKAHQYFIEEQYERARRLYLEAYKLRPDDFSNIAELLELYVITSDEADFENKIKHLKKIVVSDREKLVIFYLQTVKALLKQDLGTANNFIEETIKFINSNQNEQKRISWSFKEIRNSKIYTSLDNGSEAKIKLMNYLKFLENSLSQEEREKFIGGDFLLKN